MSPDLIHKIIYFRLVERSVLTLFVLAACIWLTKKYIDTVTQIDFAAEKLPLSKLSTTIGTPLLVVLLFVGYTYVDLTNRLEIGPAPEAKRRPAVPAESTLTYFDETGQQADGSPAPQSDATLTTALPRGQNRTYADWMQKNSRRVFNSILVRAPTPISHADADRAFYLTSAVGCLNRSPSPSITNIDSFVATHSWEQIVHDITDELKAKPYSDAVCEHLKQE